MHWFDELPQLFRRPFNEIGFSFYVREIMRNDFRCDSDELRQTLGPGWTDVIENLRKAGILCVNSTGQLHHFSIVVPGDKKRLRSKKIGRRKRALAKFETGILDAVKG